MIWEVLLDIVIMKPVSDDSIRKNSPYGAWLSRVLCISISFKAFKLNIKNKSIFLCEQSGLYHTFSFSGDKNSTYFHLGALKPCISAKICDLVHKTYHKKCNDNMYAGYVKVQLNAAHNTGFCEE